MFSVNFNVFKARRRVSVCEWQTDDRQPDADDGQPSGPSQLHVELRHQTRPLTVAGPAHRGLLCLSAQLGAVIGMRERPLPGARQTLAR